MYTKLKDYISGLTLDFDSIPEERKHSLQDIANFITKDLNEKGVVKLNFICTHNSRRSHLAQIWTQTAAFQFEIDGRSEEHTSELQSRGHLVCRLLLEKKKI